MVMLGDCLWGELCWIDKCDLCGYFIEWIEVLKEFPSVWKQKWCDSFGNWMEFVLKATRDIGLVEDKGVVVEGIYKKVKGYEEGG